MVHFLCFFSSPEAPGRSGPQGQSLGQGRRTFWTAHSAQREHGTVNRALREAALHEGLLGETRTFTSSCVFLHILISVALLQLWV